MRIDSHQHFWHYSPAEHVWMTEALAPLKRSFMPEDLEPLLAGIGFDGSVAVQARQMLKETEWLLELSGRYGLIKGVVGWVDLCSPAVAEQLDRYATHPRLKGVRHVVHDEPDDRFMLRADFQRGIAYLERYRLTYDLLLFARHLPVAMELVDRFPHQPFVVDHIAKPPIARSELSPWREQIRDLARRENVTCKLSGMAFEADWQRWTAADFRPYLDVVVEAFGPHRLMIGSNWPVELMAGDYASVMSAIIDYVRQFSSSEQASMLGGTAQRVYRL